MSAPSRPAAGLLAALLFLVGAAVTADPPDPAKLAERDKHWGESQTHRKAGRAKEALAAAQKALAVHLALSAAADPDVCVFYEWLGQLHEETGDAAAAAEAARKWVAAAATVYGEKNWRTADARLRESDCRVRGAMSAGDRKKWDDCRAAAPAVLELHTRGQYREAAEAAARITEVLAGVLGPDHPATVEALARQAEAHRELGEYSRAEACWRRVIAVAEKSLGPDHPFALSGYSGLGSLAWSLGDLEKAEAQLTLAANGYLRALGDTHPDAARGLNNLALLHTDAGAYAKAAPLHRAALKIREGLYGAGAAETAVSLHNLGVLHRETGEHAASEEFFRRAIAVFEAKLGPDHPVTARSVNALATTHLAAKDHGKSVPLYRRALEAREKALGRDHPDTAKSASGLAAAFTAAGNPVEAGPLAWKGFRAVVDHLDRSAAGLSEATQLAHADRGRWHFDTLIRATAGADAEGVYAAVLAWRGAVTARQTFARTARSVDPGAKNLLDQLTVVSRQLAAATVAPPTGTDVRARLTALADDRDRLEVQLAARSARFDKYLKNRSLTPAELRRTLPDKVALVDFVVYGDKLAAFVVRKDGVERVELGPVAPVATAADAFRGSMSRPWPTTGKADDPAVTLRRVVWEPVAARLKNPEVVLLSPDGPLCRVPFAALPGAGDNKYLIEEVTVAVIPVPRLLPELLAPRPKSDEPPSLLAVGDVDFDAEPAATAAPAAKTGGFKGRRAGGVRQWDRLPATAGEVIELEAYFKTAVPEGRIAVLKEAGATEDRVRAEVGRFEYLHFATHGFFAPPAATAGAGNADRSRPTGPHPGLLCGLALAGANKPKGDEDGVLTALEVADLNLSKTELAVLSACETGLGAVAGGEGVLGLQRAFQVAGARTTVTSLWKVDDDATRKLMGRFYDNYFKKNQGTLEALRESQVWMLQDARRRGATVDDPVEAADPRPRRTPPHYWAAFVLSGDWR